MLARALYCTFDSTRWTLVSLPSRCVPQVVCYLLCCFNLFGVSRCERLLPFAYGTVVRHTEVTRKSLAHAILITFNPWGCFFDRFFGIQRDTAAPRSALNLSHPFFRLLIRKRIRSADPRMTKEDAELSENAISRLLFVRVPQRKRKQSTRLDRVRTERALRLPSQ